MTFTKLFEEGKIGKLALKNRVVIPAMGVGLGVKSENTLLKPLKELGIPVIAAGDANVPGRIMEATLDAVNLAYGFME